MPDEAELNSAKPFDAASMPILQAFQNFFFLHEDKLDRRHLLFGQLLHERGSICFE
jgi:hypothetical protein